MQEVFVFCYVVCLHFMVLCIAFAFCVFFQSVPLVIILGKLGDLTGWVIPAIVQHRKVRIGLQ